MTYTAKYATLTTQRAYTRAVARDGLPALLAPYRGFDPRPAVVLPAQRRRFVRTEVAV